MKQRSLSLKSTNPLMNVFNKEMTKELYQENGHEIQIKGPNLLKDHQIRQTMQMKEKNILHEQKPNELEDHTQNPYLCKQKEILTIRKTKEISNKQNSLNFFQIPIVFKNNHLEPTSPQIFHNFENFAPKFEINPQQHHFSFNLPNLAETRKLASKIELRL